MKKMFILFLILFSFTLANADVGLEGVGGQLSLAMPDNIDNTIGFGVNADLGTVALEEVTLHAYLDFWRKSEDYFGGDFKFTSINILAVGKYNFDIGQAFTPYAGAGLGLEIGHSKWEIEGTQYYQGSSDSDSDSEIFIPIVGGAKMPINEQITGFAEIRIQLGGSDTIFLTAGATWAL